MELLLKRSFEGIARSRTARVAAVAGFALLTCLAASVRIPLPFSPVPITLQTFCVLCAGAMLGATAGSASQLFYVIAGVWGLPVFTLAGAGSLYLCGPTGGYLAGFVLAALISGFTARYARGFTGLFAGFLLASAVILACGTLWLSFVTGMTPSAALSAGFLPFIPGDTLKSFAAAALYRRLAKPSR
jgi:biotin transport system substrate-specific component